MNDKIKGKDMFELGVSPLTRDIYCAWSQDLEVILKGQGFWKHFESRSMNTSRINRDQGDEHQSDESGDDLNSINEK